MRNYRTNRNRTNRNRTNRNVYWWAATCLAFVLVVSGCGSNNTAGNENVSDMEEGMTTQAAKVQVVTTFYPLYYMASTIGGERAEVTNLVPAGVDPHDWTPKSRDMQRATDAQLFFYNGAGFEGWVDKFIEGLGSSAAVQAVEVSNGIPLLPSDPSAYADHAHEDEHAHEDDHAYDHAHEEGHAHEDDHAHEDNHAHEEQSAATAHSADDHGHDQGHDHGEFDPHTWVSPKSALQMAENIKNSFVAIDGEHAEVYKANYEALRAQLVELNQQYEAALAQTVRKDIVVTHQAFSYLARDYGLNQISIMGLSGDAEPRAQDLKRIADYVQENGIPYIFFEELISPQLAETLAREAKVDTLVLNPLEGLTPEQQARGENLISLMEGNLQNLVKALQ